MWSIRNGRIAMRLLACLAVATTAAILISSPVESSAAWGTVFSDEFSDPQIDAFWQVVSNGGGDAHSGVGTDSLYLEIRSGAQFGGGTWVESVGYFDVSQADYALDATLLGISPPVGDDDDSFWGFFRQDGGGIYFIGFRVIADAGGTQFLARVRNDTVSSEVLIPTTAWEQASDYRIEVSGGTATFFIDLGQVASISGPGVPAGPLRVRFDKTSPGQDRYLRVDRAEVQSRAVSVEVETWAGIKQLYR